MPTKHKIVLFVALLLLSLVFAPPSQAALNAVGPVDPATTFPAWYQDSTGLALAPCFDTNGFCPITMAAAPGFNPTLPIVFPTNFPEEGFYFNVGADSLPDGTLYIAAIEFAFGIGPVQAGQQVTFARIRMDNNGPNIVAGDYTITHPYGTDVITVTLDNVAKNQGLRFTEDIGFAAGIFTGALTGRIGPFLKTSTGLITSPDGNVYIGNGVSPVTVTGGPNGNTVTVAGPVPAASGSTSLFTLEGKVLGMSVTPSTIAFPTQRPLINSAPITVTVANLNSVGTLTIATITPLGANAADYTVTDVNCLTAPVAPSGTCTFTVTFNGAAAGPVARTASIEVAGTLATVPKAIITPITGAIDAVAPTVLATFPDTANAPANVTITATFSEPMLASSISSTTFTVTSNGVGVNGTVVYDAANNGVTFTPAAAAGFVVGETIAATTTVAMTDVVGNPLGNPSTFSFVAQTPDTIPPTITAITPANNSTGVPTNTAITVDFSEQMLGTSITGTSVKLTTGGAAVGGAVTVANSATNTAVATFTPTTPLAAGTAYTLTVAAGATGVLDQARNALATQQVVNFVTNFSPIAPVVVSPANGATGVARPVELRWQPSTDQDQDTVQYHLFLCNNQSFIGTAPNCIQNQAITPVTAQVNSVYYASVAGGGMIFTLFGLTFAAGFKGRTKILLMLSVLVVTSLFMVSCKKSSSSNPAPAPVSTDLTYQVSGLAANVTYFWKMEADDGKGGVTATPVMTFTTQ